MDTIPLTYEEIKYYLEEAYRIRKEAGPAQQWPYSVVRDLSVIQLRLSQGTPISVKKGNIGLLYVDWLHKNVPVDDMIIQKILQEYQTEEYYV